jgi:transposase-like protein
LLWHAVDTNDDFLDNLVKTRQNKAAARRFRSNS